MKLKVLLGLVLLTASSASAEILNFTVAIDGAQASNCFGTSAGTGTGTLTLDTATGEVNYNISFSGLSGTETVSHVHGAAPECTSAGIVYALPLGSPKIGSTTITLQQQNDMVAGLHYVNIHSTVEPAGEIRGQILMAGSIPTVSAWGMVVLVMCVVLGGTLVYRRLEVSRAV